MKIINLIAFILVIVGGLNWGLVGILNIDLVATIFGDMSALSRTIYALVGIAAIYMLITAPKAKAEKTAPSAGGMN